MSRTPRAAAVESITSLRQRLLEATPTATTDPSAISGLVLATDVEAPADDPATDRSTMDGYAVATADGYPLSVRRGEVYPEDEQPPMEPGEAVPVATGGRLPERADAVLKREDAEIEDNDVEDGRSSGPSLDPDEDGRLRGPSLDPGENVYRRGSNVAAGETLFERGERLLPKDAVLLDDLGVEAVTVRRRWSVAVLATGTEIHEGAAPDRDSNLLVGLARSWGHEATHAGSVPDDLDAVRDRLDDLTRDHDVVLTSGGTSVGSRDYVARALADLGDVLVRGVRTSPGKSTVVARLPGTAAVALPGRPVACHAAALLFGRPLLIGRTDAPTVRATAATAIELGPDAECLIPVELVGDGRSGVGGPDGASHGDPGDEALPRARPVDFEPPAEGAARTYTFRPSVLSSMTRATRADGFLLTADPIAAGEEVAVVPFAGVERS
ncbi:MAG: molybdopterin molybdotransferase MoeA [Haloferacaceae archaeon]